jgi:superfamily I DNA and/or RNA helicase
MWIDIRGDQADGQIVYEEVDTLKSWLEGLRLNWPKSPSPEGKVLAKVYVISPFKKVAQACQSLVRELGMHEAPFGVECGTVHRFQGKEAEIVFLVLGSHPGKAGGGSRAWASKEPNLLNVALTRAKNRIYVIGNRAEWSECPNFGRLAKDDMLTSSGTHD